VIFQMMSRASLVRVPFAHPIAAAPAVLEF
jgi:hypothetical protein